jgi:hypothetical protein
MSSVISGIGIPAYSLGKDIPLSWYTSNSFGTESLVMLKLYKEISTINRLFYIK